jgi:2,3-bisphosphoglycerate-dependent phosphoglycerate mutase
MAIELVFESHSTTVDNEQGRATGWLPGELSEQGRLQARELGSRRRDDGIVAVFSSDLSRAAETASIAFGGSGIPVLYDWRLRECDYGQRNGMPATELRRSRREHLDQPYPGRESWRQAIARVGRFLGDLRKRCVPGEPQPLPDQRTPAQLLSRNDAPVLAATDPGHRDRPDLEAGTTAVRSEHPRPPL